MARVRAAWAPPPDISTTEWANKYRYLAAESSALPGKYSTDLTPWVPGIHAALDNPAVWKVVGRKSAQIAWTDGVLNNWIGKIIDTDPSPIVGMFAKEGAAKEYSDEKFKPMVDATPRLQAKVDTRTSRKDGNRSLFRKFAGGFLKLVGSNSPSNVKSTPAPRVFVEEPDDASLNVGSQGDSIKMLEERTKTYPRRKVVFGGTPSVKGLSTIDENYLISDQRNFVIPCEDCGESHVLTWENVSWLDDAAPNAHEIYKSARPETAIYICPHCGAAWDDDQKNRNVQRGEWISTAPFRGIAGFYINELYSPFPGSRLARLVERYLEAKHQADQGDENEMIVFVNSCLGLAYEYKSDGPAVEGLREKTLEYAESTVPAGGLLLSAGVDVQHDRLAIIVRAWGPGEESWLVYWGEIYGNTIDKTDPVWSELDDIVFKVYPHAIGGGIRPTAVSIDSSDGVTSDGVYTWVRKHITRGAMAVKGSSNDYGSREIFSRPKQSIDTRGKRHTKAKKYGLRPFIVGTHKAKDLISGRLKLEGDGAGRMHCYDTVRQDYFEQLVGEVKAPHRSLRGRKVWQKKAGAAVEALDCEVYALHASRALRVHLLKPLQWQAIEQRLKQADLFAAAGEAETSTEKPARKPPPRRRRRAGGLVGSHRA